MRTLFSRIALKDIFATLKMQNARLGHDLPTSVNDRVISTFGEGFIFMAYVKFHENKTLAKNFRIYSISR